MAASITGWTAATWQATRNVKKKKGCDLGYALAVNSREGAGSMDTYTVAAPDAITAFAVPNPNCSTQSPSFFSGLVARRIAPSSGSPGLLQIARFCSGQPPSNSILGANFRINSCAR